VAFADPITKREAIFTSNVSNPNAGAEDIAGPVLTILGFHGNFYRSLTVVELYFPCSISSRNTINIRLDAKRAVYDQPIAKFNRILIPEDFTSRIKYLSEERSRMRSNFYREIIQKMPNLKRK
jgi:hypothetical protein